MFIPEPVPSLTVPVRVKLEETFEFEAGVLIARVGAALSTMIVPALICFELPIPALSVAFA